MCVGHKMFAHKPCDYFKEDSCDLDDECRFKHIKLKHGEQICYTCGKIFNIRREMLSHIREKHGSTVCHRFLKNECTVRRCLFSHKISTATNVERSFLESRAPAPLAQDFPDLHATRPVMWSQMVAKSPHAQAQPMPNVSEHLQNQNRSLEAQVKEAMAQMIPQLISQIVTTLKSMSPNPQ